MRYKDIIKTVSNDLNIPKEVCDEVYRSYWGFIKKTIKELPLDINMTEEEFNKLRTNFNIASIGKLYCTYDNIIGLRKKNEHINKYKTNLSNKQIK